MIPDGLTNVLLSMVSPVEATNSAHLRILLKNGPIIVTYDFPTTFVVEDDAVNCSVEEDLLVLESLHCRLFVNSGTFCKVVTLYLGSQEDHHLLGLFLSI